MAQNTAKAIKNARRTLRDKFGSDLDQQITAMDGDNAVRLATIAANPNIQTKVNKNRVPYGASLYTNYGTVLLDESLSVIDEIYVNGQRFDIKENGMGAIEKATGSEDQILEVLGEPKGRQKRGRRVRQRAQNDNISMAEVQEATFADLNSSGLRYETLFEDLNGLMASSNIDVRDVTDEVFANSVPEADLAHFLVYDSSFKNEIISQVNNLNLGSVEQEYNFVTQTQDDSFAGKLLTRLGVDEAQYDAEAGVMQIGDRKITNLPRVDEKGVFHNGDTEYLPYYQGYFAAGEGSRVDRLRVTDPVATALDGVDLQFKASGGDIKFKTILDVTRNLPDFDNHPYGDEILDTLKHKIVLDKEYANTNSLVEAYNGNTDDLGAVATMILDDDAKGVIDPLGTSNGSNMGKILFMADGVTINPDGSLNRSNEEYSKVGKVLKNYNIDRDNFNRNQMSFNAFLTSTDVQEVNVAYGEFALWNSEDAIVMTKAGSERMFNTEKKYGDKIMDFHGNKSTTALIADPDMDPEEAKKQHLEYAVQMAKLNPDLDIMVSPVSINSRLNMGVPHEGLASNNKMDLHKPDGTVVKNGVVQMMYMSLPQTAEHKSKNYEVEGSGRRYSTLLHYGLASKIGNDMYSKGLIDPAVRQEHVDEIVNTFQRLGVTFEEPNALIKEGNIHTVVDAPVEVDASDFSMLTPAVIRNQLMTKMEDGQININLGDMEVISPFTHKPITDSFGTNVLPISVGKDGSIPYRYQEVFKAVSLGNKDKLQNEYAKATATDYKQLTKKDNLLKNIETMNFTTEAHTDVLIPDPRLALNEVRSGVESDRIIMHRDPVIQSGNVISMDNVKNAQANVIQVNPLVEKMMDADNDGDTLGNVGFNNLRLSDEEKQAFYDKSSVVEQVNQYGQVFLGTDSSHFKAAVLANGMDDSDISFEDGKSNQALVDIVNKDTRQIIDSPQSYGAYSIDFTDEASVKTSLARLADDGIKGDRESVEHIFDKGYTEDENKAVLKALIAKSEWTGMAGSTTNKLIAGLSGDNFNPDLVRVSMDVTHSMTQSVLQMKKDAEKLPIIDQGIKDMKKVMDGEYGVDESRDILKNVTQGLIPPQAIDKFVDEVSKEQTGPKFGEGIINNTPTTTKQLAYASDTQLAKALQDMSAEQSHEQGPQV